MFKFLRKKNKFQTRNLKNKKEGILIPFMTSVSVIIIFIVAIFVLSGINSASFDKSLTSEINKLENEKKWLSLIEKSRLEELIKKREKFKQDQNKTNILIIWRWGYWNDAPFLTDSIILLSLNKKNNYISMFSIPRDLYVDYWDVRKNWKKYKWKINWLYPHYLQKYRIEDKLKWNELVNKSMKKLEEKISEITNEKIDYYVDLDFRGFVKLINSIWGVSVNVPKNLYDNKYPDSNHWFQIFSISKWVHNLNGERALMYVRTRKNTGWDFWRSQRQQQIVSGVKSKVLSLWYLTSPTKIRKLYKIFDNYIWTNIWILDAVKIFTEIKLQNNTKVYSSWLNSSCIKNDECKKGWFLFYPNRSYFWWQSVLLSDWTNYKKLSNYNIINNFSDIIFNSPKLFDEKNKISIFSKIEDKKEARELKYNLVKHWLNVKVYEIIWNILKPKNIEENILEDNKDYRQKNLNLGEYNKLIKNNNISDEYNNIKTKIIINNINKNNTIKFLQKYLSVSDENIIENIGWPKYAKSKNTKIEIIYTK